MIKYFAGMLSMILSAVVVSAAPQPEKGIAVVELFTSEGCSSCPSAEAALKDINDEQRHAVYVLEFHVDYWNHLGWKDIYSDHSYTVRQQAYAQAMRLSSNYTPQAVVNGTMEMVGSDRPKLNNAINKGLSVTTATSLQATAINKNGTITVSYTSGSAKGCSMNIALVQKQTLVSVRNGENSGRRLLHTNVVRAFQVVKNEQNKSNVTLSLPSDATPTDYMVMVYMQQKTDNKIVAATTTGIDR